MRIFKMAVLGFLMLSVMLGGTLVMAAANRFFGEGLDLIVSAMLFVAMLVGMLALDDLSEYWGVSEKR